MLFTDLVGFTPFAEERDAEDVRETLNRYFDIATDVVTRYGGTVEKFIGDAVMAVWGTPTVFEDDAERAVRAALDLVDGVRALGPEINARAGVLTGEAAVTLGATNQGMVAGDLVNTAARLQAVAQPGTVLVGEATYRAASDAIAFEAVGTQSLKGKVAPVAAWRALRVVAERGGRGRSGALEAPFVGRDDELRMLKELFHATGRERRTRLVSITGIGGIGKSRLAWEFEKYLDGIVEQVWWQHGRSPAYGEGITFWPLGEMIRARAGVAEGDDEATTRAGVARFLDRLTFEAGERTWVEPALLAVLGIDTGIGSEQLFGAWRTFFERMSDTGTVVLVFEDLHWADSGTLDFIDHLVEWSRTVPLYIVTLARPELLDRRPDWGAGRRSFTSLFLEPLAVPAMQELLAGLVPGLPRAAASAIVARAEGVPLYAVETVRMLVADGKLRATDAGTYEPAGDLSDLAVPETLTALIAARLDALEPADRSLVLDAAVLGQSFALAGLAAVAGLDEGETEARVRSLVRRELFVHHVDPRTPDRGQYAFVQALIREVAYNTLARRDRKVRHLAAARYFEALDTDEIAGALAGHYLAAHEHATDEAEAEALAAQARLALAGAAERAKALGAYEQAQGFLTQALAVTTRPVDRARLLEQAGEAAAVASHEVDAARLLAEATETYRELGDLAGLARSGGILARSAISAYRVEEGMALVTRLLAETASIPDDPATVALGVELGRAHYYADRPRDAVTVLDRVLETAERMDLAPIVAEALVFRGASLNDLGRSYEGLAAIDGGVRLAELHNLPFTVLRGMTSKALGLMHDDPRHSRSLYLESIDVARRLGARSMMHRAITNVAETSWATGDWDWAITALDELLADDLARADRAFMRCSRSLCDVRRGLPASESIAAMESELGDDPDDNLRNLLLDFVANVAFVDGRYGAAREAWIESARVSVLNAPVAYWWAGLAAAFEGDADATAASAEWVTATNVHGRATSARVRLLKAAADGLRGSRDTAREQLRVGIGELQALGLVLEEAVLGGVIAVALGPDDPLAQIAVARAHEILEPLGAVALLARIDEKVSVATA